MQFSKSLMCVKTVWKILCQNGVALVHVMFPYRTRLHFLNLLKRYFRPERSRRDSLNQFERSRKLSLNTNCP